MFEIPTISFSEEDFRWGCFYGIFDNLISRFPTTSYEIKRNFIKISFLSIKFPNLNNAYFYKNQQNFSLVRRLLEIQKSTTVCRCKSNLNYTIISAKLTRVTFPILSASSMQPFVNPHLENR